MNNESSDAVRRQLLSAALTEDGVAPAAAQVRAEFGASSHRGRAQLENDDHYLVVRLVQHSEILLTSLARVDLPGALEEHAYAAVVADGIGRDGAGSVAARLAISTLAHLAWRFAHWHMRIDPWIASEVPERSEWLYRRADEAVRQRRDAVAEVLHLQIAKLDEEGWRDVSGIRT